MTNPLAFETTLMEQADLLLRITLILGLAGLTTALMRRASAATRHMVWTAGIIAVFAIPLLARILPAWHVLPIWLSEQSPVGLLQPGTGADTPESTATNSHSTSNALPTSQDTQANKMGTRPTTPPPVSPPAHANPALPPHDGLTQGNPSWGTILSATWATGTALMLLPLVVSLLAIRRIQRQSKICADPIILKILEGQHKLLGVRQKISLLIGTAGTVPMACGIVRSKIIVPAAATQWSVHRWQMVLRHELAHIQRHDVATQIVALITRALYWFHPLAWLACRQMAAERERACDDRVLLSGANAVNYAEELLAIAIHTRGSKSDAAALWSSAAVTMARLSNLEFRLRAIVDVSSNRRRASSRFAGVLTCMAIAIVVPACILKAVDGPSQAHSKVDAPADPTVTTTATFKGGGTVELLAIAPDPLAKKEWFKPDGSPAEAFVPVKGLEISRSPDRQERQFVLQTNGLAADAAVTFTVRDVSSFGDIMVQSADGKVRPNYKLLKALLPKNAQVATIQVGVAQGPWVVVGEGMSMGSEHHTATINTDYVISKVLQNEGNAVARVTHNIQNAQVLVTAIDQPGKEHEPSGLGSPSAGNFSQVTVEFSDIAAKDVKAIRLKMRPYEWVEFKNVPIEFATPTLQSGKPLAKMLENAQKEVQYLDTINDPQRNPGLLMLRLEWLKRAACAQLLLSPSKPAISETLSHYAVRIQDIQAALEMRRNVDTTDGDLHLARFVAAEIEGWRAGISPQIFESPLMLPAPASTEEQKTAASKMAKEAHETVAAINLLADIRARSPEFLQIQLDALRVELVTQLLVYSSAAERKRAVESYQESIRKLDAQNEARTSIDVSIAQVHMGRYALAEAEHLLAMLTSSVAQDETSFSHEAALFKKMLAEGEAIEKGFHDIEPNGASTPEFIQSTLDSSRRVLKIRLAGGTSEDRKQAINDYQKRLDQLAEEIAVLPNAEPLLFAVSYARAEADLIVDRLK